MQHSLLHFDSTFKLAVTREAAKRGLVIAIKDTRLTRPAQAAVIVLTPAPPHFELKPSPGKEAGPALSKVSAAFGQESGGHLVRTINPSRNLIQKGEYPFLFPRLDDGGH